jgi:hypothetical protein
MNNVVIIHDIPANQAIELKHQLIDDGLQLVIDFTWEYTPSKYSGWSGDDQEHSYAKYIFVNDSLASFYRLKWVR